MSKEKGSFYVMTEDEYVEMKVGSKKESFLESLQEASKNDKKFTIKQVKKPESEQSKATLEMDEHGSITNLDAFTIPEKVEKGFGISDDQWDSMTTYFDSMSPIDDITEEYRYSYKSKSSGDEYQELFKKEKSMLSDVLSNLEKRSKIVNAKIASMTGKGAYGVSKNFVDLVESSVSIDNSKLSVIKEMVNIKKTAADLRMKDKRLNPDDGGNDNDSVADAFYKQIMGGGNREFLQNTLSQYGVIQGNTVVGSRSTPPADSEDDEYRDDIGFNITQPIINQGESDMVYEDKYGYISNEKRNVSICVNRYPDGSLQFIALDEDGINIKDYQLPDPILLDDIKIKPMSNFAYDRFDRKYRIIDVDLNDMVADLDDLDDDYYDSVTNDDKYDID